MPNLLAQGVEWLASQLGEHAATPVTFARGGSSVAVTATKGRTDVEVDDGDSVLRSHVTDWIVRPSALVLAGNVIEPKVGDEFIETVGPTVHTYRVLALGDGEVFRAVDPARTLIRVHTKLTSSAAA
jgi:hypothetical protein